MDKIHIVAIPLLLHAAVAIGEERGTSIHRFDAKAVSDAKVQIETLPSGWNGEVHAADHWQPREGESEFVVNISPRCISDSTDYADLIRGVLLGVQLEPSFLRPDEEIPVFRLRNTRSEVLCTDRYRIAIVSHLSKTVDGIDIYDHFLRVWHLGDDRYSDSHIVGYPDFELTIGPDGAETYIDYSSQADCPTCFLVVRWKISFRFGRPFIQALDNYWRAGITEFSDDVFMESRINISHLGTWRTLFVKGIAVPMPFDDLYNLTDVAVERDNVYLLLRGNFGLFVAKLCRDGRLDFVASLPELEFQPVWSFRVAELNNGSLTIALEFGCPGEQCCAGDECEKEVLTKEANYGGLTYCQSVLPPGLPRLPETP